MSRRSQPFLPDGRQHTMPEGNQPSASSAATTRDSIVHQTGMEVLTAARNDATTMRDLIAQRNALEAFIAQREAAIIQANQAAQTRAAAGTRGNSNQVPDIDLPKFLAGLPRVDLKNIDEQEAICPICAIKLGDEDPDTGFHEHPIKLPCGHVSNPFLVHGLACPTFVVRK